MVGRPLANPRCPYCESVMRLSNIEFIWVCHKCNTIIKNDKRKIQHKNNMLYSTR